MQIVIATRNEDKFREISEILGDDIVEALPLTDFKDVPEVDETGETLEENALLKAKSASKATGLPALADDTGLFVDAINGEPGVRSSRFAGENATYEDNRNLLLSKLEGIPEDSRTAKFVCIAALVDSNNSISTKGVVKGIITNSPRGLNGFGYDPIFQSEHSEMTFGELSAAEKKSFSHREKAFSEMLRIMKEMYA